MNIREIPSPRCWWLSDPGAIHGFVVEMQLTDFRPGQGTLTVCHDDRAWTHYWPALGDETIMQFLASSDVSYVVTKLQPGLCNEIIDWEATREMIEQRLIARAQDAQDEDFEWYDCDDGLETLSRANDHDLQGEIGHRLLAKAFRTNDPMAWEIPKVPNPDYQLLETCVKMCIDACKALLK